VQDIATVAGDSEGGPAVLAIALGANVKAGQPLFLSKTGKAKGDAEKLAARKAELQARLAKLEKEAGVQSATPVDAMKDVSKAEADLAVLQTQKAESDAKVEKLQSELAQLRELKSRGLEKIPRLDAAVAEERVLLARRGEIETAISQAAATRDRLLGKQESAASDRGAALNAVRQELSTLDKQQASMKADRSEMKRAAPFAGRVVGVSSDRSNASPAPSEPFAIVAGPNAKLMLTVFAPGVSRQKHAAYRVSFRAKTGEMSPGLTGVVDTAAGKDGSASGISLSFSEAELARLAAWRPDALSRLTAGARLDPVRRDFGQMLYQQLISPFASRLESGPPQVVLGL
jgi:hypothetical protein